MFPHITVTGESCPMWVPLVENNEFDSPGADYFVQKHLDHILSVDPRIDTLVLGCTHYPLLIGKIRQYLPQGVTVFAQGEYVADSLKDYLNRHPEMDCRLTRGGECRFLTTESAAKFSEAVSYTHLEKRISNFLLWQCSYAEFYFTDVFWPAFREEELYEAISVSYTHLFFLEQTCNDSLAFLLGEAGGFNLFLYILDAAFGSRAVSGCAA